MKIRSGVENIAGNVCPHTLEEAMPIVPTFFRVVQIKYRILKRFYNPAERCKNVGYVSLQRPLGFTHFAASAAYPQQRPLITDDIDVVPAGSIELSAASISCKTQNFRCRA